MAEAELSDVRVRLTKLRRSGFEFERAWQEAVIEAELAPGVREALDVELWGAAYRREKFLVRRVELAFEDGKVTRQTIERDVLAAAAILPSEDLSDAPAPMTRRRV